MLGFANNFSNSLFQCDFIERKFIIITYFEGVLTDLKYYIFFFVKITSYQKMTKIR